MNKIFRFENVKIIIVIFSILAAIKMIFVDYSMDEEYQIMMAYRRLSGDTLFGTMWEPHQTSAFLTTILLFVYKFITGTVTGCVIFLRVISTFIRLFLCLAVCKFVTKTVESEKIGFFIGALYFNIVPKLIEIPEFSNLQLWGLTIALLALGTWYFERKSLWLILSGIGISIEVLSYPSDILNFFFFVVVLLCTKGEKKIKRLAVFIGTCVAMFALWLLGVLIQTSFDEFIRNIPYILNFDLTHDYTDKFASITSMGGDVLKETVLVCLSFLPALGIALLLKKKFIGYFKIIFIISSVLISEIIQLIYWFVLQSGYEEAQIHLVVLWLIPVIFIKEIFNSKYRFLYTGILAGLLSTVSVIYLSDLTPHYAIPHGLCGGVSAAVLACLIIKKEFETAAVTEVNQKTEKSLILILLLGLTLVSILGKGLTLRGGRTNTNTVFGISNIYKKGPAAFVLADYMQAYINDANYEDFNEYVEDGSNCLIVTEMAGFSGTTPYMFKNLSVSHFSIVDPTSYDERLLTYWELYPEKQPSVIAIDCWYSNLCIDEDSWIMKYIEGEYNYTRSEDGRYVRFYFK